MVKGWRCGERSRRWWPVVVRISVISAGTGNASSTVPISNSPERMLTTVMRWRTRPLSRSSHRHRMRTPCSASCASTVTPSSSMRTSVTAKRQNSSIPPARTTKRGEPVHASACVGKMLGQAVSSSAPETRCGRSASAAATSVRGSASGRPQCTMRGRSSPTIANANADRAARCSKYTMRTSSPRLEVPWKSMIAIFLPSLCGCVIAPVDAILRPS